jgi:transaldolase
MEEQIRKICDIVDGDISAEAVSTESREMIADGRRLARIHKNVVVKLPLTREGIQAAKALSSEEIRVNVTLCFSAAQALLAAKAEAYIVSPFIGRIEDTGWPGMVLDQLFDHPLTERGLHQFLSDYNRAFELAKS